MNNLFSIIIPKNQWKKNARIWEYSTPSLTHVEQFHNLSCAHGPLFLQTLWWINNMSQSGIKDLKNLITWGCDNLRFLLPKKDMHHVAHDELRIFGLEHSN
jgi:hypothetical protein